MAHFDFEGFRVINALAMFSNGALDVTNYIQEFRVRVNHDQVIPQFYVKYRVDTALAGNFTHPYDLQITIGEKHYLGDNEIFSLVNYTISMLDVPANLELRSDKASAARFTFIDGHGVDKAMYNIMNKSVYGMYEQSNIFTVISDLWQQAASGWPVEFVFPKPDNTIITDIFIPSMIFGNAVRYIASIFGVNQDALFICTDYYNMQTRFIIAGSNMISTIYTPLILYFSRQPKQRSNIDAGEYSFYSTPVTVVNSVNYAKPKLRKNTTAILHPYDKLYDKQNINTEDYIDFVLTGDSSDIKYTLSDMNYTVVSNPDMYDIVVPENIATSVQQFYKFMNISIEEPLRLDHWNIGQVVTICPGNQLYTFSSIKAQVLAKEFVLTRQDDGRWHGVYNIDLSARGPLPV